VLFLDVVGKLAEGLGWNRAVPGVSGEPRRVNGAGRRPAVGRRRARWATFGAVVLLVTGSVVGVPFGSVGVARADGSATFSYTGSVQHFTVPAGATQLTITARGAQGGGGSGYGQGGTVTASFVVSPADEFDVHVGGRPSGRSGGWPNGGSGGGFHASDGYGGGGSSDVRPDGESFSSAWIVAGGGGGLSAIGPSRNTTAEGLGAGTGGFDAGTGGNGPAGGKYEDVPTPSEYGGGGGSQSAGGVRGTTSSGSGTATAGSFGQGGNGSDSSNYFHFAGGGGGGGWYGGGGAGYPRLYGGGSYAGDGGGGSGYVSGAGYGIDWTDADVSGNGSVTIEWGTASPTERFPESTPERDLNVDSAVGVVADP
jgi:hypothetical protein